VAAQSVPRAFFCHYRCWAHRLHRLHHAAQALDYAPLTTLDPEVALPLESRVQIGHRNMVTVQE
jgi:hypothetical protein